MSEMTREKPLTYAQIQYLDALSRYPDFRITNRTATALEKRGLVEWRHNPARPWSGEWVLSAAMIEAKLEEGE